MRHMQSTVDESDCSNTNCTTCLSTEHTSRKYWCKGCCCQALQPLIFWYPHLLLVHVSAQASLSDTTPMLKKQIHHMEQHQTPLTLDATAHTHLLQRRAYPHDFYCCWARDHIFTSCITLLSVTVADSCADHVHNTKKQQSNLGINYCPASETRAY